MRSPPTGTPRGGSAGTTTATRTLSLRWENEGWTATGEVGHEAVTYVVRLSATWQVRQFLLFRDLDEPDLWLGTDGSGRWGELNGAHRPDIDGCVDIHLDCTPFTATLPIRRLQLEEGDSVALTVAHIDVETLGVTPVEHVYVRTAHRRWRHIDESGARTDFDVDEFGLVRDLPGPFPPPLSAADRAIDRCSAADGSAAEVGEEGAQRPAQLGVEQRQFDRRGQEPERGCRCRDDPPTTRRRGTANGPPGPATRRSTAVRHRGQVAGGRSRPRRRR